MTDIVSYHSLDSNSLTTHAKDVYKYHEPQAIFTINYSAVSFRQAPIMDETPFPHMDSCDPSLSMLLQNPHVDNLAECGHHEPYLNQPPLNQRKGKTPTLAAAAWSPIRKISSAFIFGEKYWRGNS